MSRSARWLISVLTVLVVIGLGEIHAHLVGHYGFTELPRFAWLLVFIALLLVAQYSVGLPEQGYRLSSGLIRTLGAAVAAAAAVSVMALAVGSLLLPRLVVLLAIVADVPIVAVACRVVGRSELRRDAAERVLAVVGDGEALALADDLERLRERPAVLAASFLPAEVAVSAADPRPLIEFAEAHRATVIVLDRDALADEDIVSQAAILHRRGIRVRTLTLFYDEWLGKLPLGELERSALLFDVHELHHPSYARLKRSFDVTMALAAFPVLLTAFPVVWVLNLWGNRGPMLFRQERVGKDGRIFEILKFRSMSPHQLDGTWTSANDERLGRVGRVLRRTHVDELPQLVNVLRRDLSIVGPRPEQPRYVAELVRRIEYYDLRHLVLPGITGWAQVNFDYGASGFDALEKLQYEFYYLRHQSLMLDARIVGRTLRSIVGHTGR